MREEFAYWAVLLKESLKRDWKLILVWVLGMGGFAGGFVPAFVEIGKGNALAALFEMMKNPAMISLCGPTPVETVADYTLGAVYAHTMLLFSALIAMLIAGVHVVSRTRKEEENGLTEFICSYRAGRHASSLALLMEELLIHVLIVLVTGGMMAAYGAESMEAGASFLFAAAVGLAGITGAVIALVVAQIMPTSAGATGAALATTGVLYILRAGTDISNVKLSMFNPMGWAYLTYPFTENNWLPLLYAVIFCVLFAVLAFVLERGRDMGSGYLPERTGKGKVSPLLLSVHGFLLRLNRGTIIGWTLTFLILGATYGSIYGDMETFLESNELIKGMFMMTGASMEGSFTSTIMVVLGGLVAIVPVVIVNKLFSEETNAHLGQLCATKVTRTQLYFITMIIAVCAAVLSLAAAAGGLGGTALFVTEKSEMELADFLSAGMNYFPSVLFNTALAALMLGWIPKLGRFVYIYIGYCIMLNYFRGILKLPEWFEKTAVLSWIPRMPVDEFDGAVFAVITAISVVMMLVGYLGYRRRDMIERI